jgi:hypothetical protein
MTTYELLMLKHTQAQTGLLLVLANSTLRANQKEHTQVEADEFNHAQRKIQNLQNETNAFLKPKENT